MKHRHHLTPKHRGGTDDESNLTEPIHPTKCEGDWSSHAIYHFCEWKLHGLKEDWFAWKGLAGVYGMEEILTMIHSEAGVKGGGVTYTTGTGIWSMSPEEKKEAERKGGKTTGEKFKLEGIGVCGIPPEEHSARMASTNQQKWECPECEYTANARWVNHHMKEVHNLPKNRKIKCTIPLKE